jgi:hypothetical protein
MKNQDTIAPCPIRSAQPKTGEVASVPPGMLSPGMRFFRHGHWWEIDGYIKGRATGYYRCKPACFVESRFYTESEIKQALEEETTTMNQKTKEFAGRGTGRLLIEPLQAAMQTAPTAANPSANRVTTLQSRREHSRASSGRKEPLKVLLVGSRQAVKRAIQTLYMSGFANLSDWSAFQNRSDSDEVLSILIHKI